MKDKLGKLCYARTGVGPNSKTTIVIPLNIVTDEDGDYFEVYYVEKCIFGNFDPHWIEVIE